MSMTILLLVQVLLAVAMIALILIQRGRGADTGAAFGSGASTTVFGARGSASFLTRTTAVLAILFFSNCFVLSYVSTRVVVATPKSVMQEVNPADSVLEKATSQAPAEQAPSGGTGTPEKTTTAGADSEVPKVEGDTTSEVPTVKPDVPPAEAPSAPQN